MNETQPVPIPSYLIAIACGNVRYRPFPKIEGKTWTCGVWAEPEMIDACYWEFSEDTGRSVHQKHIPRLILKTSKILSSRGKNCDPLQIWSV